MIQKVTNFFCIMTKQSECSYYCSNLSFLRLSPKFCSLTVVEALIDRVKVHLVTCVAVVECLIQPKYGDVGIGVLIKIREDTLCAQFLLLLHCLHSSWLKVSS